MRKISITEGLNELKLYDAKIMKAINFAKLIGAAKKSSDKVGVLSKKDFEKYAKASYQSVQDLTANRNILKSAIVKSNAITTATVNNKIMTIAEIIERKKSIAYEKLFLDSIKSQYTSAVSTVDKENKKVDLKVDELLTTLVGKDSTKKISPEEQEAVERPYRENNEYCLVDPLNLYEIISDLEAEIDGFLSNCDTALVLSNATTFIEIDL